MQSWREIPHYIIQAQNFEFKILMASNQVARGKIKTRVRSSIAEYYFALPYYKLLIPNLN
jgi:hypothetical protein